MKRFILPALFFLIAAVASAQSRGDVFEKKFPVTWLGLDFTGAKLIGDRERLGSESDIRTLLDAWNDIFLKEPEKYNVAKAIGRPSVEKAIDVVKEKNQQLEPLSLYSDQAKDFLHLQRDDIQEIVSGYDFPGMSGIGLMFNVESFSKLQLEANVWITFINMETREVLFTERLTGKPGGAGLRNYWANSMYEVLKKMEKKEFEMWRKKYYRPQ